MLRKLSKSLRQRLAEFLFARIYREQREAAYYLLHVDLDSDGARAGLGDWIAEEILMRDALGLW